MEKAEISGDRKLTWQNLEGFSPSALHAGHMASERRYFCSGFCSRPWQLMTLNGFGWFDCHVSHHVAAANKKVSITPHYSALWPHFGTIDFADFIFLSCPGSLYPVSSSSVLFFSFNFLRVESWSFILLFFYCSSCLFCSCCCWWR